MPFVQIKIIEGVFSEEQKRQMLDKVSEALLSVEGENLRQFTHVIIDEIKSQNWSIGGKAMKTEDVKALVAGKK